MGARSAQRTLPNLVHQYLGTGPLVSAADEACRDGVGEHIGDLLDNRCRGLESDDAGGLLVPDDVIPPAEHPPITERVFIQNWGDPTQQQGNFIRQNVWGKSGAERCLVADSLFWEAEAERVPPPDGMVGQALATNTTAAGNWAFNDGNTLVDCYRHGKYPPQQDNASLRLTGGLVGYNMLFVDGHVGRMVDRRDAFRGLRLRYPE